MLSAKEMNKMQIRKWFGASLLFALLAALSLMPWSACAQSSCPEGCRCLTVASANQQFGEGNFDRCQANACGEERSPAGAMLLKYCFSPASPCPADCRCLTEEEAKKLGYDKFCGNEKKECGKDARRYPKFCYQIPPVVCPTGCVCASKDEAAAKGLKDNCLDANGNPIVCGTIDAQAGLFKYCFKTVEPLRCWYDYNLGKCVGGCSAGKKCQLNTIYRDPKTGKVTFAECHCK